MTHDQVKDVLTEMLRDQTDNITTLDGDDWKARNRFTEGDRVYLRCAFYIPDGADDYVWKIQDQTSVELDITDAPTPDNGANAVVEADVAEHFDGEKIRLTDPKVVGLNVAETTIDELSNQLD